VGELTSWIPAILLGVALLLLLVIANRISWRDKGTFDRYRGDAEMRVRAAEDAARDEARVRDDEDLAP
jgi:hypothetical protein